MNVREPRGDDDWDALFERLTGLAVLALLVDRNQRDRSARLLALQLLETDTREAADLAGFLHAREREGIEL
ncbi:hypothetical protein ACIQVO_17895 [Streptomyces sp. NPDC101062]|uniref:hypothetical protein n=1 Tax=unclassified Streptomyces TaxID=2593676 RepID=UPI0037F470D7